jgi:murein DD-endopeptidase MepM/ murein hydrolase activator NlpD
MATRRRLLTGTVAVVVAATARGLGAQARIGSFSYPIGIPGRALGDGFVVRHGFATENTWYNPGWLHCGEDWYALNGDTAGAAVYAIGRGEVVFAGSDYPGLVVIVRHAPDLYSMYGHLDDVIAVGPGERVERGTPLGTVFARTDGRAPSHLHFEVRTFLTHPEVNGERPRYAVACGYRCPPGPGYWPIDAPEHPSDLGWRNPTHIINGGPLNDSTAVTDAPRIVVAVDANDEVPLWSGPTLVDVERVGTLRLVPGERFPALDVVAGDPSAEGRSAEAYHLRYAITLASGDVGWVDAMVASPAETGSDGRPAAIRFHLLPDIPAG